MFTPHFLQGFFIGAVGTLGSFTVVYLMYKARMKYAASLIG
jgi:hypothetical protein